MSTDVRDERLDEARAAVGRRDWPAAHELFSAMDEDALDPEDLELVAKAAWWTGHQNRSIEARERAYAAYVARGDRERAAFCALTLQREYSSKLAGSMASGWLKRAETLLRDAPDSPPLGYLELAHGLASSGAGEGETALAHFDRALEISARFDDPDLTAWAMTRKGMHLITAGRVDEGWALMEEVAAAAVGGELGPYTTGGVFCNVVSTCRDLADYARAGEWSEAATRWCERQSISGFPGICRVNRAEVMRLVGAFEEAEREVSRAADELREFNQYFAAAALHELGEVRLRRGDLPGAEDAFAQSAELGHDPQPGRALLLLAQGKAPAAAAALDRSLEDAGENRLARARLLPARAEAALALGEAEASGAAADELAGIAADYGTAALRAGAAWVRGISHLIAGDGSTAARELRSARQRWREVGAPYEAAKASALLADAYALAGDEDGARAELETARTAFERLGARLDAERVAERLDRARTTVRTSKTFMFTDVVGSTSLLDAIGDEAWQGLRRWHDETLRACFAQFEGEEVDHAGDGFFVAFDDAASAVACAIHVQRRLAEHRRTAGFAPEVRIGVHAAEAMDAGGDYSGRGVHEAARIGAIGGGGEIVASAGTVAGLDADVTERRSVQLKGIAAPVEVVSIAWR